MQKTINELRTALKSSVVNFTFTKLNGEKREAKGTINGDLIPEEYRTSSTSKPSSDKVLTYFDFNVNGYRSVSLDSKVSF
jgi:hypothetical protein